MTQKEMVAMAKAMRAAGYTAEETAAALSGKKTAPEKEQVEWVKFNPETGKYDGETIMVNKSDLPYLEARKEAYLKKLNQTPAEAAKAKKEREKKQAEKEKAQNKELAKALKIPVSKCKMLISVSEAMAAGWKPASKSTKERKQELKDIKKAIRG